MRIRINFYFIFLLKIILFIYIIYMSNKNKKNILDKILLINVDEKGLPYSYQGIKPHIDEYINYDMIIICAQFSRSKRGSGDHFPEQFGKLLCNNGFELFSKLDATRQVNRETGYLQNIPNNVRTRIYIKPNAFNINLNDNDIKKLKISYQNKKSNVNIRTPRKKKKNINSINSNNTYNNNTRLINNQTNDKDKINLNYYVSKRKTIEKYSVGYIYNLFHLEKNDISMRFCIINYNIKDNSNSTSIFTDIDSNIFNKKNSDFFIGEKKIDENHPLPYIYFCSSKGIQVPTYKRRTIVSSSNLNYTKRINILNNKRDPQIKTEQINISNTKLDFQIVNKQNNIKQEMINIPKKYNKLNNFKITTNRTRIGLCSKTFINNERVCLDQKKFNTVEDLTRLLKEKGVNVNSDSEKINRILFFMGWSSIFPLLKDIYQFNTKTLEYEIIRTNINTYDHTLINIYKIYNKIDKKKLYYIKFQFNYENNKIDYEKENTINKLTNNLLQKAYNNYTQLKNKKKLSDDEKQKLFLLLNDSFNQVQNNINSSIFTTPNSKKKYEEIKQFININKKSKLSTILSKYRK